MSDAVVDPTEALEVRFARTEKRSEVRVPGRGGPRRAVLRSSTAQPSGSRGGRVAVDHRRVAWFVFALVASVGLFACDGSQRRWGRGPAARGRVRHADAAVARVLVLARTVHSTVDLPHDRCFRLEDHPVSSAAGAAHVHGRQRRVDAGDEDRRPVRDAGDRRKHRTRSRGSDTRDDGRIGDLHVRALQAAAPPPRQGDPGEPGGPVCLLELQQWRLTWLERGRDEREPPSTSTTSRAEGATKSAMYSPSTTFRRNATPSLEPESACQRIHRTRWKTH